MMPAAWNNASFKTELQGGEIRICTLEDFSRYILEESGITEKDFILADTNTASYCFPLLQRLQPGITEKQLISIDAGEDEKNISTLDHIWGFLQHAGADRNSRLINLGGGMITDIGGFAASSFKRGIKFIHIPTSLMGMVDAAIGGKTAINLGKVKNQAGSFAIPESVVIYPGFLDTLPWEEFISGYAEILKIGLAMDAGLWNDTNWIGLSKANRLNIAGRLEEGILSKAVKLKADIVSRDLNDNEQRQCLNFGHSIAHGLEALYMKKGKVLMHGIAVVAGMICESMISNKLVGLSDDDMKLIIGYMTRNYPPVDYLEKDIADIISFIRHDKKNFDGDIRMSLIEAPGQCVYGVSCSESVISDCLKKYLQLS